jgi:hypothetical protein
MLYRHLDNARNPSLSPLPFDVRGSGSVKPLGHGGDAQAEGEAKGDEVGGGHGNNPIF